MEVAGAQGGGRRLRRDDGVEGLFGEALGRRLLGEGREPRRLEIGVRGLAPRNEPVDPVAHGLGAHGIDHARDLVAPEPERLRLGGGEHPPLGGGELFQLRYVRLLYHAPIVYINVNELSIMISDLGMVSAAASGARRLTSPRWAMPPPPRSPHPASPRRPP